MSDQFETVKLDYNIHKCSSYSGSCWPENILVDNTKNHGSRWFTDSNQPDQFLMLKLYTPSIVETITFGKYFKAHVSDLKKFQVFGGLDEQNLSLLLNGGLKNDNTSEVFRLRHHTTDGFYLPVLYLKVVPLQSWGPPHNFTIWHIALAGKNDDEFVRKCIESINLRKEEEAVRVVLKHLRRRKYKDAFEALSRESGVQLEGPIQERLWNTLVENGDFEEAERIFEDAVEDGALEWYLSWQKYTPHWRQLSMCSAPEEKWVPYAPISPPPSNDPPCADREWIKTPNDKEFFDDVLTDDACSCKPGPRGGHQLVLDSVSNTLYLYGGWDGGQDLSDLWSYDVEAERWSLRCENSAFAGGPSARSCHKMVLLPHNNKLYTLGRYLDTARRQPHNMKSDFYTYDTKTDEWSLLMEDTRVAGGPGLLYDHQMCIDTEDQIIFVFGGRLLIPTSEDSSRVRYSGLFMYYIRTNTWQEIDLEAEGANGPLPRMGHSMLYHPSQQRLYVFAGQRNKEVLLGLWYWDVRRGCGGAVSGIAAAAPGTAACTQRATLDAAADEIVVLSGMTKEKDKHVFNTLWVFSLQRLTWACIYRNESSSPDDPRPRFAHQLVYDPTRRVHYLFGGNPGNHLNPRLRLDDLWALELSQPSAGAVRARVRARLREARYRSLAALPAQAARALHYLRSSLSETLDHHDPKQREHFHSLPAALFVRPAPAPPAPRALSPQRPRHRLAPRARPRAALVPPAILGAEDSIPENHQPYEDINESWCPGCAECETCSPSAGSQADHQRNTRIEIFDQLCQYFRPSTIHPSTNVTNLVHL